MDELSRRMRESREAVRFEWGEAEAARGLARLEAARRRRTVARTGLALAAAAALALGVWAIRPNQDAPTRAEGGAAPATQAEPDLRLPDGSLAWALRPGTVLLPRQVDADHVVGELVSGAARFEVTRRPERLFRVEADTVRTTVLGTVFVVDRGDAAVRVDVLRGRVRVDGPEESRELGAGESGSFARVGSEEASAPATSSAREGSASAAAAAPVPEEAERGAAPSARGPEPRATEPRSRESRRARRPAGPDWRALAEAGRFDEAFAALEGGASVNESRVGDLLLAADAARLSGHPSQARGYLRQVVDDHRRDPRASLAAFTLGRVLMNELSRPVEAAEAFATARRLDRQSALAEDALAREVEAWHRAGRGERARELGREYVERYPRGVRLRAVRRYAGLDEPPPAPAPIPPE
ncbi:MAG: hypothetical protein CMN29_31075 [Sandaracinus sp.]|nr:hypothetical protein [Sandaracinus sp.]